MPVRVFANRRFVWLVLFLLPLFLYLNTLKNDYALDDSIVLTQNTYVQKGLRGIQEIFTTETFTGFFQQKKDLVEGGRYRPLSLVSFAIEHQLWGDKPGISHFINSFLYALLCLILFSTILGLLDFLAIRENGQLIAFISTLLFAVHPVHTEVVANIKGRDELLAVLFLMLSLNLMLRTWRTGKISQAFLAAPCLFLALLSKENAIFIWPALAILLVLRFNKSNIRIYAQSLIMLLIATAGYIMIRVSVVGGLVTAGSGELMNNPYLFASTQQKTATIVYTLLIYFKLLFIPHPLTYDYYPYHIALQNWSGVWVYVSILIHLGMVIVAFVSYRKHKLISFGIFLYLITLVPMTNLLVNIGSFMNERFLFLPSVGFVLIAGSLIVSAVSEDHFGAGGRKIIKTILGIVILLFIGKTITRNTDWENNLVLFTHDVKISSGSAKGNCAAGGVLYETALTLENPEQRKSMLQEAIRYLNTSIRIYPNYIDALLLLGNAYYELDQDFQEINKAYYRIFKLAPTYQRALSNYSNMLINTQDITIRIQGFRKILEVYPKNFEANYQLGISYGRMLGQLDTALVYLSRAVSLQPDNSGANRDLGVAYAMLGNYRASLPCFEKVVALKPDVPDNYINLGMSYQNLGELEKAQELFAKAKALQMP